MPILRPSNINKKEYPGNGSVIGPTTVPTVGISTEDLCTSTNSVDSCIGPLPVLGCTYTHCYCPCCNICTKCLCTSCDRNVPSGMWKASEQATASSGGCWGQGTITECTSPTTLCCTGIGATDLSSNCSNCYGYHFCKDDNYYYFAAPSNTQVSKSWFSRNDAVSCANSRCGNQSWYVPPYGELNSSRSCRQYWDEVNDQYWSDSAFGNVGGLYVRMQGGFFLNQGNCVMCVRAFRKTNV